MPVGMAISPLTSRLSRVWHAEVRAHGNEPRFLATASFLFAFATTRVVTRAADRGGPRDGWGRRSRRHRDMVG